jgi:hypothetical protein
MKKTFKKLKLAKETVRTLELGSVRGGTYATYSCGVQTNCGGSVFPYVCEDRVTSADGPC